MFNKKSLKNLKSSGKIIYGNCKICGKEIKFYPKNKRLYCSQPCNYQAFKKNSPEKYKTCRLRANNKRDRHLEYLKNKDAHLIRARKSEVKRYFGGNYDAVMQRDKERCVSCGMTKIQHYKKYNRNIDMHHIDLDKNNHKKSNLQVLCKSCHNKIHKKLNI